MTTRSRPVTFVEPHRRLRLRVRTLFPETSLLRGRPENHLGAIFATGRPSASGAWWRAADLLGLNLPATAAALLASPARRRTPYVLWNLFHARALARRPSVRPVMIRQRNAY